MSAIIRDPKDFWSGVIFIAVGLAAVLVGDEYPMGSAGRMGPGYFPTVLGGLLAVLGSVSVARSLIRGGERIERFAIKNVALVLGATVLFGVLVRNAGIALAIVVLVLAAGLASSKFRFGPYALLAVGMAAFAVLVFVKALGLPMPVFGPWLGV
jgi:hypothetical protein